ncbi:MAG: 6-phosphogluconolactonase [Nostocoides sp.]
MSQPRILVHPTKQVLADAIAARLVSALVDVLADRGVAHVSLTGGSMGSAVIASLSDSPAKAAVDWTKVVVWWGDERYLPTGDPDRNDVQNDAAGLASLGLDPANIHRAAGPDRSGSAEESAAAYSEQIRAADGGEFDIVLLGVGPDGHVASLFPHHPAAETADAIAIAVHDSPKPPPDRVSLTFESLNRSRRVWFLVSGADKADAVRRGTQQRDPQNTPASAVTGSEETLWLIDEAAADVG